MSVRTPKELINLYWNEVWNNRNVELIRELCADPIVRHDPESVTELSIDDQVARVQQQSEDADPYFEHEILHADDVYVTSVWNMHTRKGKRVDLCGIEVFKAENGKFTHCWNSSYTQGRWGREGDVFNTDHLTPPDIIASPDEITPEWLQRVFKARGLDAQRISIVGNEQIGHGNLSQLVRTDIKYNANAENAIQSVICKFSSAIPGADAMAKMYNVYARESAIYDFLGDQPVVNVPQVYFNQVSSVGDSLTLVMEDLSGRTRPGDQIAGCSKEDAFAVVEGLSKLHGQFWHDERVKKAPWCLDRKATLGPTDEIYKEAARLTRERFEDQLNKRVLTVIDSFNGKIKTWTDENVTPHTLIHGEPRVDNILFEEADDSVQAWFIDWQFADYGSPMFDVAYFLAGSLETQIRNSIERELIEMHHKEIAKIDPGYTLEQALHEYAHSLPFALFATVGAVLALADNEHSNKLLTTLLLRNVSAIDDWKLLSNSSF